MLTFDAHLDLAMNALEWNRDLTRPIDEIRQRESTLTDKPDRGRGTVCFPEMRRGHVALCVATLIARFVKPGNALPGWHSPEQAWAQTQGQLAWYRAMEEAGQLVQIKDAAGLETHLEVWQEVLARAAAGRPEQASPGLRVSPPAVASGTPASVGTNPPLTGAAVPPIGYILSLEGADSILTLKHLERAYVQGLRAVGPAHYGPGVYAQGTDATGGLGLRGRELLKEMARLGIILDATHLCDDSFWEAMDAFQGPVWASHSNCRTLTPHNRQFADDQIRYLVRRGAVMGVALDAWMLMPGWVRGQTTPEPAGLTLAKAIDHIDHICQIAGDTQHVGLGTDLDGGFGREQCPADVNTIADLARLPALLRARGYRENDLAAIMRGNFLRFLRTSWR